MNPERLQQIQNLFHAALKREPAERAAFLSLECVGDEGLRGAVESLLKHYEQAKSFVELPATVAAAAITSTTRFGLGFSWTPDGQALMYVDTRNGVSNIWSQPIDQIRKDPIGTETMRAVWSGTWPRVPMTVVTQASGQAETWVTSNPAGRIEATFSYDNTFPSSKCAGQITVSGPGIMRTLEGSRPASGEGQSNVKFGSRSDPRVWGTQRVCGKEPLVSGSFQDMTTPEGVLLEADSGENTYVGFSRDDSGSFFPLDDLLTGKGFTVNGNRTGKGSGTGDGSSWTWTGSASVVITPVQ